jgi:hypothetical protein
VAAEGGGKRTRVRVRASTEKITKQCRIIVL